MPCFGLAHPSRRLVWPDARDFTTSELQFGHSLEHHQDVQLKSDTCTRFCADPKQSTYAVNLGHFGIGDRFAAALTESLKATGAPRMGETIRDLNVSDCRLSDKALARLAFPSSSSFLLLNLRSLRWTPFLPPEDRSLLGDRN